jgi:alkylation response protein AidB-like acyl-CoA dehydrogenase
MALDAPTLEHHDHHDPGDHHDLRGEVRRFVAEHRVPGIEQTEAHPPHDRLPSAAQDEWTRRLREGRWLCLSWPERFGGRGLDAAQAAAVHEEFARLDAPRTVLAIGERLVAPSLLAHGCPALQEEFLPRILSGEHRWCQGFSEPESGSDLASVRTRGVIDGDELVITGQKVWTSEAQHADWMFLLCRTDPTAPPHRGLSMVLLPLDQPGVEVRPLRQAHGGAGFNEVFLDGARAQLRHVVGNLGDGWKVATTTLGVERGGEASVAHLGYEREWHALVDMARSNGAGADPVLRARIVQSWIDVQLLRYSGMRQLAGLASGAGLGPLGSLFKLQSSTHHRRFGELAVDIEGAAGMLLPDSPDDGAVGYAVDRWQRIFFEAQSRCISRGTNDIQHNVIAERVLGLPR